jgi:DNA-binding beta-propeller fold protein YncE
LDDLIVVSADGTRVYTLGISSPDPASSGDSAGVYAFDAATLAPLGHWAPQPNLTSIAVSDDGRHVYAAADGGPSAAGDPAPEFGASITAYDTSDGSVAVIAGRLLARDLSLGEHICR